MSVWPRLAWVVTAGATGLALLFVGVERSALIRADAEREGLDFELPGSVFALLITGVIVLNIAVFSALTILSRYRRSHPDTRQAPVWVLLIVVVLSGGLGLVGYITHNANVQSSDAVLLQVDWGFVALQSLLGMIVISALVVMGVRWSPGHQPARARR